MDWDFWLFGVVCVLTGAGWLALVLAPLRYRFAWVFARSCAMLIASIYASVWLMRAPLTLAMLMWPLDTGLLSHANGAQTIAVLAWGQMACLTLFVGSWMVEDAPRRAMPHRVVAPLLIATALTGPCGLLCFILVRDGYKLRMAKAAGASQS